MKQFLTNLFSENSTVSAMRVMSIFALLVATYLAVYGVQHDKDLSGLSILCSVFVGAAFTGKVAQKFAETKVDKTEEK